jgi:hypothetical protein
MADWLFSYQKTWLRPDVVAGLTTAAVVIPKGNGLCHDCRATRPGGTVHSFSSHGDLRCAGNFSTIKREHHSVGAWWLVTGV